MKKILISLLAVILLVGCGKKTLVIQKVKKHNKLNKNQAQIIRYVEHMFIFKKMQKER